MPTLVAKKTFSIKKDLASQLDNYSNKSQFVNEALTFYIAYLEKIEAYKRNFLEEKIQKALDGDFYSVNISDHKIKNTKKYVSPSKQLEENLLLALSE